MIARALMLLLTLTAGMAAAPSGAGVPVRPTGHSAANKILQKDILQTITYYGAAFDCPAPTAVKASMLNSSMISSSLRKPSLNTSYEEWDAIFCGKTYRFFVSFWPDPQGGSFLSVQYPYPPGAPSAFSP